MSDKSVLVHNGCGSEGQKDVGEGANGTYEKADYHGDKNNNIKTRPQIMDKRYWIILYQ